MSISPESSSKNNDAFLASVLNEFVIEKRRKRRWSIFFKLALLIFIVIFFIVMCTGEDGNKITADEPHTALINLTGEIGAGNDVDADKVATALNNAFKNKGTKAIILRINSPGGSPVQSSYIYNEIMRLRALHPTVPVYAVCVDVCASGAYYVASAAQDIYADPSSLVGSIGVIMSGFGADKAIEKLGISRRVYTAGSNKDMLDPFLPVSSQTKAYTQQMLGIVHQQFIAAVEAGRGDRLKKSPDLFSGLVWTGVQAKNMGLVDGFGSTGYVARTIVKDDKIIDYTIKPTPFERFADRIGASMGHIITSQFEGKISE
jgi:protease-4